jgi:DNA-binding ferritin-like protein
MNSLFFRDLLTTTFSFTLSIKMVHWQTNSYAVHKTTDSLLLALDPLIDQLIETIQGLNSKINLEQQQLKFSIKDKTKMTTKQITEDLTIFSNYMKNSKEMFKMYNMKTSGEIQNIIDSIVGELEKAKYLMTFS